MVVVLLARADVIGQPDAKPWAATDSDTLLAFSLGFGELSLRDTTERWLVNELGNVHRYSQFSLATPVRNDLGNVGSAVHVMLFELDRPFGFRFRDYPNSNSVELFNRQIVVSRKAFSNVAYTNGANAENNILVDLARPFGTALNAGLHFGRVNSLGFYGNQQAVVNDFSVYAAFRNRDNRYLGHFMFNWLDINVQENGGIANDSIFEQNVTSGRAFIPTNLTNAGNQRVGFNLALKHQYQLLSGMPKDSLDSGRMFVPALTHSIVFNRSSDIYKDVPNGFYEEIYLDSVVTMDSTFQLGVDNVFGLDVVRNSEYKGRERFRVVDRLFAGAGHQFRQIHFDSLKYSMHNIFLELSAGGRILNGLEWWAGERFMLAGHNALDNKVEGGLVLRKGKSELTADVAYHAYRPDFITERYVSNHFMLSNSFAKTNHLTTGVRFEQRRLRSSVSFRYHLLQNLVVFGEDRLPFQSTSVNQLLVVRLNQHLQWRWIHFRFDGAVQWNLSGDDIRVPNALGRATVYYQNNLFKRKLRLQVGYEVSYWTSYRANAYNPALATFHLQEDIMVGNYPFMDVFLNIGIKKFQAFFKIEHWNAGLMGYRYYHVPHYPVNDLAWKFGVRWAFLDDLVGAN